MAEKQSNNIKGGAREGAGRPKGVPNKATQESRELVAKILSNNLPYIESWILATAEGIVDDKTGKHIVLPNPAKACDIVQGMIEYSVPKLARTEVVGDEKQPQRLVVSWKK